MTKEVRYFIPLHDNCRRILDVEDLMNSHDYSYLYGYPVFKVSDDDYIKLVGYVIVLAHIRDI